MAQAENPDPSGDRPIIVGGGPDHIRVQLPHPSQENRTKKVGNRPKKFSLAAKDPAVPFKEVVITNAGKEIIRWPLPEKWKITIR